MDAQLQKKMAEFDKFLCKMNLKTIREYAGRNTKRVADFSDSDKWTCWRDIMDCEFGRKAVNDYVQTI